LASLKTAHAAKDVAGCDSSLEQLNQAWHAASEDLNKAMNDQGAAGAQQGPNAGGAAGADDVQDAEIVE
jgi:molecular chaperone DnaK